MAASPKVDEYGRSEETLPRSIPRPLVTESGRPSLTMVKMIEKMDHDTRMGGG